MLAPGDFSPGAGFLLLLGLDHDRIAGNSDLGEAGFVWLKPFRSGRDTSLELDRQRVLTRLGPVGVLGGPAEATNQRLQWDGITLARCQCGRGRRAEIRREG